VSDSVDLGGLVWGYRVDVDPALMPRFRARVSGPEEIEVEVVPAEGVWTPPPPPAPSGDPGDEANPWAPAE